MAVSALDPPAFTTYRLLSRVFPYWNDVRGMPGFTFSYVSLVFELVSLFRIVHFFSEFRFGNTLLCCCLLTTASLSSLRTHDSCPILTSLMAPPFTIQDLDTFPSRATSAPFFCVFLLFTLPPPPMPPRIWTALYSRLCGLSFPPHHSSLTAARHPHPLPPGKEPMFFIGSPDSPGKI